MKITHEKKYKEIIADIKNELFDVDQTGVALTENDKIFNKFMELTTFFTLYNEKNLQRYIEDLTIQKMKNIFPYLFEPLPNSMLLQVNSEILLKKPFKINIGETIIGTKSSIPPFYLTNIFDSFVLPVNHINSAYDFDKNILRLKLTGNSSFIFDIDNIDLWVNYNNDTLSSLIIYNQLKECKNAAVRILHTSGKIHEYSAFIKFDPDFSVHPNTKAKLMLNSPELFFVLRIEIEEFVKSLDNIEWIEIDIAVPSLITKYKLQNIFHVNFYPFINIYSEYAKLIEYDSTKESYPMISMLSDSCKPIFIRDAEYFAANNKRVKLEPEIYCPTTISNTYKISYSSNLIEKKYYSIQPNIPPEILKTTIKVLADWINLSELELENINLSFKNKQIGIFNITNVSYKRFIVYEELSEIVHLMKLLRMQNINRYTSEDLFFIMKHLISKDNEFFFVINDFIDAKIFPSVSNSYLYVFEFYKTTAGNQVIIDYFVECIEEFLNYNFGIENKIACQTKYKLFNRTK